MTFPHYFAFYSQKTRISPNSHIFVCYNPRLPSGPAALDPDRLKFFRAIEYDLRNHNHCSAITVPRVLCFTAKKLEFCLIPIFSYALADAFRVDPGSPDPDRLKIFRAIKYDLRNHSHCPTMIVPYFLQFIAKKL